MDGIPHDPLWNGKLRALPPDKDGAPKLPVGPRVSINLHGGIQTKRNAELFPYVPPPEVPAWVIVTVLPLMVMAAERGPEPPLAATLYGTYPGPGVLIVIHDAVELALQGQLDDTETKLDPPLAGKP